MLPCNSSKFNTMNPFRVIQSYVPALPFQKPNGPLRVIEGAAIPTPLQYIKSIDVPP